MKNIPEIIEDDRNGKQLSQTERRIAVAYVQGKYDAVRELKISNNSNTNAVLDKIRAEIEDKANSGQWADAVVYGMQKSIAIIDKYRKETE